MDGQPVTARALREARERGDALELRALIEEAEDLLARQGDLARELETARESLRERAA